MRECGYYHLKYIGEYDDGNTIGEYTDCEWMLFGTEYLFSEKEILKDYEVVDRILSLDERAVAMEQYHKDMIEHIRKDVK